jgi:hypothetical protein
VKIITKSHKKINEISTKMFLSYHSQICLSREKFIFFVNEPGHRYQGFKIIKKALNLMRIPGINSLKKALNKELMSYAKL